MPGAYRADPTIAPMAARHSIGRVTPLSLSSPGRAVRAVAVLVALVAFGGLAHRPATAQVKSPVAVDDSPTAGELLQRAIDCAAANPAEASRLIERVLAEHPSKLVPWRAARNDDSDRFRSARDAANEFLLAHPPVLERFRGSVSASAQRRVDEGDLGAVWRSAKLTSAGFDAALRLAQGDLERAAFASARRQLEGLEQHPDFVGDRAARARTIIGLASAAAGDADTAGIELAALRDMQGGVAMAGAAAIGRLQAQVAERGAPIAVHGVTPLDSGMSAPTGDATWHLLAAQPLPQSLAVRAAGATEEITRFGSIGPQSVERLRERGSFLTAAPTIAGNSAFVSEGGVVRAYDRLSGRLRWLRELPGFDPVADGEPASDMNIVSVWGDSLVTLVGHALPIGRTGGSRVVCLDTATGEVRWQTALSQWRSGDDGLEGLFPYGTPVIDDGLVFVSARKVTSRLEVVSYVVALDLADGRVRWARHLCSSSSPKLGSSHPLSSIVARDGLLYASISTGAAACLDARSGEIRWLKRLNVPVSDPRYESEPWEIAAPLLTSVGLVMVAPDQLSMLVLDVDDGRVLHERPIGQPESWGQPRYFLGIPATAATPSADEPAPPAGAVVQAEEPPPGFVHGSPELIVAVGSDIVAFSVDDLVRPRWKLSETAGADAIVAADERRGVRGRVQAVERALIVPMRERVLVVDADTGAARTLVAGTSPGNPLLVGPQLLLATDTRVEAYMPFDEAERFLRRRIADDPRDPDRALALVVLGLRAKSFPTAIDGAEAARQAIEAEPDPRAASTDRADLFARLLDVDAADLAPTDTDGDRLHAMLAAVASTPSQNARRLVALGDWQSRRGRTAEAAATWTSVLADRALASALVPDGDLERAALLAVTTRLATASLASMPEWRESLQALGRAVAENAEPSAVLAMVDRLPIAGDAEAALASFEALQSASTALLARGDGDMALDVALRAWRRVELADDAAPVALPVAARLAGLAVANAIAIDAPVRGAAIVDAFAAMSGAIDPAVVELVIADRPVSVGAVRTQLAGYGAPLRSPPPRVGSLAGDGRELPGRLLRGMNTPGATPPSWPSNRVIAAGDDGLHMLDAKLQSVWTLPFDDPDPRVIAFDGRGLLLWTLVGGDAIAVMIDPDEGRIRWMSPRLSTVLPPAGAARAPEQLLAGGQPFDAAEILPLATGNRLVLVRRSGECATLDLRDGGAVSWSRSAGLAQVHGAWADDATILLGGIEADGRAVVIALDPRDGVELSRRQPTLGSRVNWVSMGAGGVAVIGTEAGVEAFDPSAPPGEVLWRNRERAMRGTLRSAIAGPWMLVTNAAEGLVALRLADGRLGGETAFATGILPELGEARVRDVIVGPEGVIVQFEERLVSFDRRGRLRGMDAIADDRDYRFVLPGAARLVGVSFLRSEQIELEGGGRRTQYSFRAYQFDPSKGCKLVGNAMQVASLAQNFDRARLIDGWLLLSTGTAITAIPLAAAGAEGDADHR